MIPSDLAARLRLLNEASFFNTDPPVAGLQRAREIQAQLPDLVPGQRFFATLQRTLPDGTFRAIVAGQQMTLSLNTAAKAGDTLELEVSQLTPRAVFARIVGAEAGASTATQSAQPSLSPTGRLISFLLTGQPTPKPASLGANQPLLTAPPSTGAQLVPLLRQAVAQSGLFYESHQAEWVLGRRDTATLQREPQGGMSTGRPLPAPGSPATTASPAAAPSPASAPATAAQAAATSMTGLADSDQAADSARTLASASEAAVTRSSPIAERLMPVRTPAARGPGHAAIRLARPGLARAGAGVDHRGSTRPRRRRSGRRGADRKELEHHLAPHPAASGQRGGAAAPHPGRRGAALAHR